MGIDAISSVSQLMTNPTETQGKRDGERERWRESEMEREMERERGGEGVRWRKRERHTGGEKLERGMWK